MSQRAEHPPEAFDELHKFFYENFPIDHFRAKSHLFLTILADADPFLDRFKEPVTYGGLTVGPVSDISSAKTRDAFLSTAKRELLAVPYHAAETVLRLYLAHRPTPVSPWAHLARRDFAGFRTSVDELAESKFSAEADVTDVQALAQVFKGPAETPSELAEEMRDRWEASLGRIGEWLSRLASFWLENAAYNSFKHGLVFFATEFGFQLDDGSVVKRDGEAIRYLEEIRDKGRGKKDGKLRLYDTHSFLTLQESVLMTEAASQLIDAIITTARWRYLDQAPERGVRLFDVLASPDAVADALGATGIVVNHVSASLLELERH